MFKKMKLRNVLLVLLCLSFFSASWAQTAKDTVNLRDKYNLRQAMYEAKLAGRNQYRLFDPENEGILASQYARQAEVTPMHAAA